MEAEDREPKPESKDRQDEDPGLLTEILGFGDDDDPNQKVNYPDPKEGVGDAASPPSG